MRRSPPRQLASPPEWAWDGNFQHDEIGEVIHLDQLVDAAQRVATAARRLRDRRHERRCVETVLVEEAEEAIRRLVELYHTPPTPRAPS